MPNNGFRSDVEPGGLYDTNDIRILICYILSNIKESLTMDEISNIIREYGLANYFEITHAVTQLHNLNALSLDEENRYDVTDAGKEISETLSSSLPYSVKKKALKSAQKAMKIKESLRDNIAEIVSCGKGYKVVIVIPDGELEMLRVELYVDSFEEATTARENFLSNPLATYLNNLNVLLGYKAN